MAAPVVEIGRIIDASSSGTANDYIPIYSLDEIPLERSQKWRTTVGTASYISIWEGSEETCYSIDFRILVGWGAITSIDTLNTKIALFHALCSPQFSTSGGKDTIAPPPAVRLVIAGQVNMMGFLKNIKTVLEPPWSVDEGQYQLTGISCRFTGTFVFMPGMTNTGPMSVSANNTSLAYKAVKANLYYLNA